jgi:hypothetical protein
MAKRAVIYLRAHSRTATDHDICGLLEAAGCQQVGDHGLEDMLAAEPEGCAVDDGGGSVGAREAAAVTVPQEHMIPVKHLRVDLRVRVEISAAQVGSLTIFRFGWVSRAQRTFGAAGTTGEVVAPIAAQVNQRNTIGES